MEKVVTRAPPPYWCYVCKEGVYGTVKERSGGMDSLIVCNKCGSEDISSYEDGISKVWNPSRR